MSARGGKRRGAGRKPRDGKALVSHSARPEFAKPTPAHVTLRMSRHVWSLRSRRSFRRISAAFEASRGRLGMRLIEFSVQGNHLHLIVEADNTRSLSRGMQGLCIRIAKALNSMMKQSGRVFADHYHSRLLRSPAELTHAIAYVLGNAAHHFGEAIIDLFCSAAPSAEPLLAEPRSWLLRRVRLPDLCQARCGRWRAIQRAVRNTPSLRGIPGEVALPGLSSTRPAPAKQRSPGRAGRDWWRRRDLRDARATPRPHQLGGAGE
jgi:putative transposase